MKNDPLLPTIAIDIERYHKLIEMIVGMKYMYEHHWHDEKIKSAVCEKCREEVEIFTPCKASPHYPCWYALNDMHTEIMAWIGITNSDKNKI